MKKLKIAVMVRQFVLTGGAQRYAVEVTRRLAAKGHQVDLYAREVDEGLIGDLNFIPMKAKWGSSSILNVFSFALDKKKILRNKRYDIVHSHEPGYRQDLLTIHTFSYKTALASASFLKRADQIYLSPRGALYLHLERQLKTTPWVAAVSQVIKKDVTESHGRAQKIAVIPPGVDTKMFHPDTVKRDRARVRREEGIPEHELVVLFVGSEFRRKGLDSLIPAIGGNMRLVVVGRGERLAHYRSLAQAAGNSGRVAFKGLSDNVMKYFAAADVVVLPSLREAFGMSVLEGMACGLPVIASATAGVAELIKHGVNGLVCENREEMNSLLQMLTSPAVRERVGARARETAEGRTWDVVADEYEDLYYRIAREKAGRDDVCR